MKIRHMDDSTFQKIRHTRKEKRHDDRKMFKAERREQRLMKYDGYRVA